MVSKGYSKSMPLYVVIFVLTILLCAEQSTITVAAEKLYQESNTEMLIQSTSSKKSKKKFRTGRLSGVKKLAKKVPKRLLAAAKEQLHYSVIYPVLAKYYEIREDGLQRSDYFNIIRKLFYLYLAKKCYDKWRCTSTLFYLATGGIGKLVIDWIETGADSSNVDKGLNQKNYVNKMLSFLNEEQKQHIAASKELLGSVSVAQEFNDPRLLKENQTFHLLLNSEQAEYLDAIIFEYMSHHNLLRSHLTRKKKELRTENLEQLYGAGRSQLPWADAIDKQIDFEQLEALSLQACEEDLW